jgi:hypothetical protein
VDGQWKVRFVGAGQGEAGESNVDQGTQALHTSLRPAEYALNNGEVVGNHYSWAGKTGAMGSWSAGNTTNFVLSFRWNDPRKHCLINRVRVGVSVATVATSPAVLDMRMLLVRNVNANDSGTNQALTNKLWPKRTGTQSVLGDSKGASAVYTLGSLIVATTSSGTAGDPNSIQDTNPISTCTLAPVGGNVVGATSPMVDLIGTTPGSEHPILLTMNEGFRLIPLSTTPTGGAYTFSFFIDWTEVPVY